MSTNEVKTWATAAALRDAEHNATRTIDDLATAILLPNRAGGVTRSGRKTIALTRANRELLDQTYRHERERFRRLFEVRRDA